MPNHCANLLIVSGDDKELRRFAKAAEGLGKKSEALDLNRFFPEPKEIQDVSSGHITINGKSYNAWRHILDPKTGLQTDVGIEAAEAKILIRKYGATNLYDWHCKTYGTKWGVYDVDVNYGPGELEYRYKTAWSPFNQNVLCKMSVMFPKLLFSMNYGEQGSGFYGYANAEKGIVIAEEEFDTKGKWVDHEDKECTECDSEFGHWSDDVPEMFKELLDCSG